MDPNTGDAFIFRLLDDAGGRFKIDGNQLKVANGVKLDFEQAQAHQIKVLVTDQAGASFEKVLTISVTDVNPEVMTFGSASDDVIKASKTGNFKDMLDGGAGNDSLWGGYGNDRLTGGTGSDVFVFDGKLGTSKTDRKVNFDTITDYNVKEDAIWLEGDLFKGNKKLYAAIKKGTEVSPTKLAKKFFALDRAKDGNDHFIYDTKKRVLSYDPDGVGSKAAIEIATFAKNANLKKFSAGELFFI